MTRTTRAALPAALIAVSVALGALALPATPAAAGPDWTGIASYYGPGFHGRQTANGERFNMHGMTAAHRSLPFGTKLRVTNQENGRSVTVRVNDRGPFHGRRIIDLSRGAAAAIGMVNDGIVRVSIERL